MIAPAPDPRAAEALRQAWQTIAESIIDTMRKLKGEAAAPEQRLSALQAELALASAAAKSGDQDAAKRLPGLARILPPVFWLVSGPRGPAG